MLWPFRLIDAALQDHLEVETVVIDGIDSTDAEACIDLLWTLADQIRNWAYAQNATD